MTLFNTSLKLGFGTAAISGSSGGYGFGEIDQKTAISLLHYALEKNIKIYDTAPIYGFGNAEKTLGKAFLKKREKIFYISKCGITWHQNKRVNLTNDPKICHSMLKNSLHDLQTDYLDLYMIHWPDSKVDIRKPLEVLKKYQKQGIIKHIGLCNTNLNDLTKALEIISIYAVSSELNLFNSQSYNDLKIFLQKHHIKFFGWGTLDKGIISGSVYQKRKYQASDARSWAPWWEKLKNRS